MIQEQAYKQIMDRIKEVHATAWEFMCYHEMQIYHFDAQKTKELATFLYDAFIDTSAADFSLTEAGNYLAENWDDIILYEAAPEDLYDLYSGFKDIKDFDKSKETIPIKKPGLDDKILSARPEHRHSPAPAEKEVNKDTCL